MKAKEQPIIVIRRKKAGHGHHGGAWKVAYADFVTAMMAFFLVMWLAAQDSRIRDSVAGYFQQPGVLPHETSNSVMASGMGGIDANGIAVISRKPNGLLPQEQKSLVAAAEHIKDTLLKREELSTLRDQIDFAVSSEGLRMELVEKTGSSFFDSGSPVLRGEAEKILLVIAEEIGKLGNDVVIEGHTDSRPYATAEKYGNWELSADRANAAQRAMVAGGLHDGQLRAVRGFADTDLRYKDNPYDPRNRRVSIVVRSQVASAVELAVRTGYTPPSALEKARLTNAPPPKLQ